MPVDNSHHKARATFALLTALATLVLIGVGGLVTSHEAGMAVPDWPTSYGYNMFFLPISQWTGGAAFEHVHRLAASVIGFLTTLLMVWFFGQTARPWLRYFGLCLAALGAAAFIFFPLRHQSGVLLLVVGTFSFLIGLVWPSIDPAPRWKRIAGVAAFFAVVLQGLLGGLRVALYKDEIGIFHALLAQSFLVLVCWIALMESRRWSVLQFELPEAPPIFRSMVLAGTALIFLQLALGATMRHQHAGLSIPDFPLAYGKIWPRTDAVAIESYNALRIETSAIKPITAFQVVLQMIHRGNAAAILIVIAAAYARSRKAASKSPFFQHWSLAWLGLICCQIFLGAATIWTHKSADVATGHVVLGAASLVCGAFLSFFVLYRCPSRSKIEGPGRAWPETVVMDGPRTAGVSQ